MSRPRLARALGLVIALACSFALAELALWALDHPRFDACDTTAEYAVGDPVLGFRGDPTRPVAGVTPNALGLRGPVPQSPKPDGERRLLFLGDSTVWGLGVALEETFAARVASLQGPEASYLIGAFPSYSSYHSRVLLERLLALEPDVAVLYLGARNDADRARYYRDAEIPERRARLQAGWHRIRVLRGLEGVFDRAARMLRRLRDRRAQARVPPAAFRENVDAILSKLEEVDVPAIVVLPPLSTRFEERQPVARLYREILAEAAAARELGIVAVDEELARGDESGFFFEDGFHLSVDGHRVVARAVDETLRDVARTLDR